MAVALAVADDAVHVLSERERSDRRSLSRLGDTLTT